MLAKVCRPKNAPRSFRMSRFRISRQAQKKIREESSRGAEMWPISFSLSPFSALKWLPLPQRKAPMKLNRIRKASSGLQELLVGSYCCTAEGAPSCADRFVGRPFRWIDLEFGVVSVAVCLGDYANKWHTTDPIDNCPMCQRRHFPPQGHTPTHTGSQFNKINKQLAPAGHSLGPLTWDADFARPSISRCLMATLLFGGGAGLCMCLSALGG